MDISKGEITETAHLSHGNWPESNADSIGHERALQILSTEHWSLLSQRSLAYHESLTRVAMFLTVLSMSFVALAFFAQATGFTPDYLVLVVIIACFNLFVGLATFVRIVGTWIIEGQAIQGMNRIRHAYTEISPGVTKYFVAGIHDDPKGIAQTFGAVPDRSRFTSALYGL